MANDTSIQVHFLQKIKDMLPSHVSFVNELADLLQVSNDSAYRRIRGETALSLDETIKICKKYRISLDALANTASNTVTFQYQSLKEITHFRVYLSNMLENLQKVKATNGRIVYAADDIPIFHHFKEEVHAAFKMFYWLRSVLQVPELQDKKFSLELIPKDFLDVGKQIYTHYQGVNATEIWTEESADSTLKQIAYYWEAGLFAHQEDAIMACEQLHHILQTIQQQAAQKHKSKVDLYELYASEIQVGNNSVLVHIGDLKLTYLRHQTLNTIITQNLTFCAETEIFLENLMQKSILLSGVSEKQRHQFFQVILRKTEALLNRIKAN